MGGLGTRLADYTATCPKSLVPVNGHPFFEYQLNLMINNGFKRFLFCIAHMGRQIEEYFGEGSKFASDITIEYSYDGDKLLGTAGAIVNACDKIDDDFLLIYGDSYMDVDYEEIIYRYYKGKEIGKQALMTIYENSGLYDNSNVLTDDNRIIAYSKKNRTPDMKYIDYGISVFSKAVFESLEFGKEYDLSDIQSKLVTDDNMSVSEVTKRFYEIGSENALKSFEEYILNRFDVPAKAVFLDRDGVINDMVYNDATEQIDSPFDISDVEIIDGVIESLKKFRDDGYRLFLVTNQPAAAKGKVKLNRIYDINRFIVKKLSSEGIVFDDVRICPHHPKGQYVTDDTHLIKDCDCRKPKTGMIDTVLRKYNIDIKNSYMVGDSYTDILAGQNAGLSTVFLGDLKCDLCKRLNYIEPDYVYKSLSEMADKLI